MKRLRFCAALLFCFICAPPPAEARQGVKPPDNQTFGPEVAVAGGDYARARAEFRTKLVIKGPSPQAVGAPDSPEGVAVVEYPSGGCA